MRTRLFRRPLVALAVATLGSALAVVPTAPASASSISAPILAIVRNTSANSNCTIPGLHGVAKSHVHVSASTYAVTHYVSSDDEGIFAYNDYVQNSATYVDYLSDCVRGDWDYAVTASYPTAEVHRTFRQQFICGDEISCVFVGNIYSSWSAGWAGTVRP